MTCGLRKSYAQAAKDGNSYGTIPATVGSGGPPPTGKGSSKGSPAPPSASRSEWSSPANSSVGGKGSPTPPGNAVSQQLAAIAASLMAAAPGSNGNKLPAMTMPPPVAPSSENSGGGSNLSQAPAKGDTLAEIRQLEAAIAAMTSPSMQPVKDSLQSQLEEKRKMLQALKPLGQRLDGTRAALERSRKRKAHAEEALQLAQMTLKQAAEEEDRFQAELNELEATVGLEPQQSTPSLQALGEQLAAAVEQLKAFGVLTPNVAEDAQQQSAELLAKFQATVKAAEVAAQQMQQTKPTPMRIIGKTPVVKVAAKAEAACAASLPKIVTHRLCGKQPVQSHLDRFWGPAVKKRNAAASSSEPSSPLANTRGRMDPY